jgi:hypothetical protein
MAIMLTEIYDAFREANVSDETARKAAEAVAAHEARFADLGIKVERVESGLRLVQAMLGVNLLLTAGVLWRVIGH